MVNWKYLTTFEMSDSEKQFFTSIGDGAKGLLKDTKNAVSSFYNSVPTTVKMGAAAVGLVGLGMIIQSVGSKSENPETCRASYYEKTCSRFSCSEYDFKYREVSGQDIQNLSKKVETGHVVNLSVSCN